MIIYTSYYAKVRRAPENLILVQVSNSKPSWWQYDIVKLDTKVCPDWSLVDMLKKGAIEWEEFSNRYIAQLERTATPASLLNELQQLVSECGADGVVLLCYEKNPCECHRSLLAQYLNTDDYIGEL